METNTVIKLKTLDQRLIIVQRPIIASGDVGTVSVEYELDTYWDGFAASGVFYTDKQPGNVYEQPLQQSACVIPWEVLQNDCVLHIGLRGVDANGRVKTAESVRYQIMKGSPRGTGTAEEPTPDVYQQLLTLVDETKNLVQSVRNDADSGKFDGDKGDKGDPGDDYVLTKSDKTEIAEQVKDMVGYDELLEAIANLDADDVGADARGTAENKVSGHNTSDAAHNDIRLLITGLTTRLNALANSTDEDLDQLAEIVAYIKANKSLIDSITTSKVNVADIIDNLTTSVSNKPLSAKMGVELKKLIAQLSEAIAQEAAARETSDAVLSARMNAFTSLPDGSTTGDAELLDARIDCEGKTWSNAGEHIRGVTGRIVDACCNKEVTPGENYNLFKISEVTFQSRLQDDSEEIISSNPNICVSGWIPVEYGKYYTYSALYNGERVTSMVTGSAIFGRIHVKLADGTVLLIQQSNLKKDTDGTFITNSWATIRANIENMVAIRFQSTYVGGIDVSTAEKLKAFEPMFVEGDTAEEARNNALTFPYIDGDIEVQPSVKYFLKHDDTKADKTEAEKIFDACCDEKTVVEENYNLLKISEVTFQSRLQDDSEEIISSNPNICVSGWIPVEYGKYYTYSALYNGERVTSMVTGSAIFGRIHVKLADGTVLLIQQSNLKKDTDGTFITNSWATIRANIENMVAIRFQSTYASGIDVSTAEKLKAFEPMFVEGDTAEEAYNNALTFAYSDGDAEFEPKVVYIMKKDPDKADKKDVEDIKKDILNSRSIGGGVKYDGNFIPNERFIRGIANLRDSENAKEFDITITNKSGATIKNAAIAVGLHNTVGVTPTNNNLPFQIYDNVFSKPTGFKFYDGDTELPYYIESESNCNYIVDKNIKTDQKTMAVFSDGKIAVYNKTEARMQISDDGGVSWTNICNNITSKPYRILLPDSQDNLFVASTDGRTLYKYTSSDGYMTGTAVIDMAAIQEIVGTDVKILIGSILAEDSDGNLYLGTYQTEWCCVVMKSADHGDTWTVAFSATDCQHVHNLYVNKKVTPNEIFLALDANEPHAYVSTDAGATWTRVDVPYKNREYAFRYAGENFYIGCGERNVLGGATLYKTTDYNDQNAYYPLFDNGQGIRDVTNVIADSDDVLIAGGCVGDPVMTEQLFLSEDRGETWKTVLMRPYYAKQTIAGIGLRTFSRIDEQILSQTSSDYAMRFVYGNGAKTILVVVGVGDIPVDGKTITLKTGYVANVEQMEEVLTVYENIDGKVADIHICDGYVVDAVSNKRVMTADTELSNVNTKLGQTSEYKILANHAYKLNGSVNLGELSRLNFRKGFTVSLLFRKEDGKNYLADDKYHVIFQTGDTKLVLHKRSICLMSGETNIFKVGTASTSKLYVADEYLNSVNEDYIRLTAYFTDDDLPVASLYTGNNWIDEVACEAYPITVNFNANDFIVGDSDDNPNIARIEIYNRVLTHGEILSLTNGCNLVTDGSLYN